MKKLIFIVPQLSQPRCIKRIESVQKAGIPFKVYGFDTGLYSENISNLAFPVEKIFINKETNKLRRILYPIRKVREIVKENKKNTIFYLFGFETAYYAIISGSKKYIYEESDISAVNKRFKFQQICAIKHDRQIIKKSLFTVFTSQGFVDYYFGANHTSNIVLMPNKLNQYFEKFDRNSFQKKSLDISHIKFGFIGYIRYSNTIVRFAKVIGKYYPQHEFHFYGNDKHNIILDKEIRSYNNIKFHGTFRSPQDLSSIYSNIDINIVCYDTNSTNVRLAEPNKLYESIYFKTPIVVSKRTFLEKRVKELCVGDSIDASSDDSIINYIEGITLEQHTLYQRFMSEILDKELLDDPTILLNKMTQLYPR